jgi:hypothetical protein
MTYYDYNGIYYDIDTTDPTVAKQKIQAHLGETSKQSLVEEFANKAPLANQAESIGGRALDIPGMLGKVIPGAENLLPQSVRQPGQQMAQSGDIARAKEYEEAGRGLQQAVTHPIDTATSMAQNFYQHPIDTLGNVVKGAAFDPLRQLVPVAPQINQGGQMLKEGGQMVKQGVSNAMGNAMGSAAPYIKPVAGAAIKTPYNAAMDLLKGYVNNPSKIAEDVMLGHTLGVPPNLAGALKEGTSGTYNAVKEAFNKVRAGQELPAAEATAKSMPMQQMADYLKNIPGQNPSNVPMPGAPAPGATPNIPGGFSGNQLQDYWRANEARKQANPNLGGPVSGPVNPATLPPTSPDAPPTMANFIPRIEQEVDRASSPPGDVSHMMTEKPYEGGTWQQPLPHNEALPKIQNYQQWGNLLEGQPFRVVGESANKQEKYHVTTNKDNKKEIGYEKYDPAGNTLYEVDETHWPSGARSTIIHDHNTGYTHTFKNGDITSIREPSGIIHTSKLWGKNGPEINPDFNKLPHIEEVRPMDLINNIKE